MRLVLVLGDQLTPGIAALRAGDRARDVVVMAEVLGEATYVPHHPQKIALILAAMRKHAERCGPMAGRSPIPGWTTPTTPRPSRAN